MKFKQLLAASLAILTTAVSVPAYPFQTALTSSLTVSAEEPPVAADPAAEKQFDIKWNQMKFGDSITSIQIGDKEPVTDMSQTSDGMGSNTLKAAFGEKVTITSTRPILVDANMAHCSYQLVNHHSLHRSYAILNENAELGDLKMNFGFPGYEDEDVKAVAETAFDLTDGSVTLKVGDEPAVKYMPEDLGAVKTGTVSIPPANPKHGTVAVEVNTYQMTDSKVLVNQDYIIWLAIQKYNADNNVNIQFFLHGDRDAANQPYNYYIPSDDVYNSGLFDANMSQEDFAKYSPYIGSFSVIMYAGTRPAQPHVKVNAAAIKYVYIDPLVYGNVTKTKQQDVKTFVNSAYEAANVTLADGDFVKGDTKMSMEEIKMAILKEYGYETDSPTFTSGSIIPVFVDQEAFLAIIFTPTETKNEDNTYTYTFTMPDSMVRLQPRLNADVNMDGKMDILDVIKVNKLIVGAVSLLDEQEQIADVNGNGEVDSNDSLQILKYILGIINQFEAEPEKS